MENAKADHVPIGESLSLRDLSKWYWENDDLDYPEAASFEELNDEQVFEVLRVQFISGDCGDFAIALHTLTGWALVNFFSSAEGPAHSGVVHPTGRIIDFVGFTSLTALRQRYGIPDLLMGETDVKHVIGVSGDWAFDDDEMTGVERAKATIRLLNHPPFDLIG